MCGVHVHLYVWMHVYVYVYVYAYASIDRCLSVYLAGDGRQAADGRQTDGIAYILYSVLWEEEEEEEEGDLNEEETEMFY